MRLTQQALSDLCLEVCHLAQEVGAYMFSEISKVRADQVVEKDRNSLVSYVDIEVERRLVEGLRALLPGAGFVTEEGTVATGEKEWSWVIDPLDGTTNYLFGLPFYCTSIALAHRGRVELGVIYEPGLRECFYAWRGGGAWLNGRVLRMENRRVLAESLVATGFPYRTTELTERLYAVLRYVVEETRGVRRLGSAAMDLAYVACGRFDAYYEAGLNPWDIAAGALLVEEAGGVVTDFEGGGAYLDRGTIIAGSPLIQGHFLQIIKAL